MKTIRLGAMTAALAAVAAPAFAASPEPFKRWDTPHTPGCAYSVERSGERLERGAVGRADLEHDGPNTPETIFEAGSVSKQFTAAAVLLLAEDGKLRLDDDVRRYLPELPDYGAPITIDHLLRHTSGLRDWGEVALRASWPRTTRAYELADVLDIAARQKALNHRPGAEFSYTNTGYTLLALIVERVSGRSLADFTEARIFRPLGMKHTSWRDDFRRVVPGRAVAYSRSGDTYRQDMPFENAYGNGGLLTTVDDLMIWNRALAARRLGRGVAAALEETARLADGRAVTYGRGLYVRRISGELEVAHSGSTAGYRAWLGRYPQHGLSIAVLCNAAEAEGYALGRALAQRHLPPSPAPAPAPAADRFVVRSGVFANTETGQAFGLTSSDGRLSITDGPELMALGGDRYTLQGDTLAFSDPDRFVLQITDAGRNVTFQRVDPPTPSRARLSRYVGAYTSAEALTRYEVTLAADRLLLTPMGHPAAQTTLAPLYEDAFAVPEGVLIFQRDAEGRVRGFRFAGSRVWALPFDRVDGADTDNPGSGGPTLREGALR